MSSMMSGGAGAGAGATSASTGPDFPTTTGPTNSSTGPDFPTPGASPTATNGGTGTNSFSSLSSATNSIPIIGPIISGVGSIFAGQTSGQEADNRAILYSQQALLDKYNAGTEVTANQQRATADLSAVGAQSGASGVTTAGSPMEAMRKTISDANMADVKARWIGNIKSSSDMYQSQLARWSGSQDRLSGWIQGGTDFAQAGMQAASLFG